MLDLDMMRRFAFASAAVHMVLGLVILGALGGHWLDGRLQTYPWLTMALPCSFVIDFSMVERADCLLLFVACLGFVDLSMVELAE